MNLKEFARMKGTNLKKIADETGIPPTTLYAISKGDTVFDNVGIGTFAKLAEALGVSMEELRRIQDDEFAYASMDNVLPEFPLSPEEHELVTIFDSLDEHGKRQLLQIAKILGNDR